MRYKTIYIMCFVLSIILLIKSNTIYAEKINFKASIINDETSYNNCLSIFNNKTTGAIQIRDFAVSQNRHTAILFDNMDIEIYNDNLELLYRLDLNYSHCNASIEFDGDLLNIYIKSNNYFVNICFDISKSKVKYLYNIEPISSNENLFYQLNANNNITIKKYKYSYYIEKNAKVIRINNLNKTEDVITDISINTTIFCFIGLIIAIICIILMIKHKSIYVKVQFKI